MNEMQPISLPDPCIKSTEYSIHTRRCFITGEYCSQQTNVQKERQRLHENGHINAFVIMNFSSVSDVVYQARMKPFIESLSKYLYLDKSGKRIACIPSGNLDDLKDKSLSDNEIQNRWKQVSHIHVHRADSNPVSNYIICNRICQQMQMADLIIVDVSVESANVFYEFGLATAFQKLILPICFCDSFYTKKLPKKLNALCHYEEFHNGQSCTYWSQKNHIDCYPWRRTLFEHFGIRYYEEGDIAEYLPFSHATNSQYGFSDTQYGLFPYNEKVKIREDRSKKKAQQTEQGNESRISQTTNQDNAVENDPMVGEQIYGWLEKSYNRSTERAQYNTLVRYTMNGFLNSSQAGLCIINFYNNITKPMLDKYCFCGDRVAILGRPNKIWDDPKDRHSGPAPNYSVSDLIRIGMDQATYTAERQRMKTSDYLCPTLFDDQDASINGDIQNDIKKQVKSHIRNRSIPLSPDNPVYVIQYQEGIQRSLDAVVEAIEKSNAPSHPSFFCLYHVMLDTLRYANEVVVDLSSNSIQAMFWLGAAHGSDIYAVTVRHEMTEHEHSWSGNVSPTHDRPIFDIGGLWTAILRHGEMDSFYNQLKRIQLGVDQHARLKLPETDLETHEYQVFRQLYHASPYLKHGSSRLLPDDILDKDGKINSYNSRYDKNSITKILQSILYNDRINAIHSELARKNRTESLAWESYYRDRFWRQLLRNNQLHLFLPLSDTSDAYGPRLQVIKWDMDTVAELSHYLSKRKVIGRYQFDTLRRDEYYGKSDVDSSKNATTENYIVIGADTKPLSVDRMEALSLAEWLEQKHKLDVRQLKKWIQKDKMPVRYRGFFSKNAESCWGKQYLDHDCIQCDNCTNQGACKKSTTSTFSADSCQIHLEKQRQWKESLEKLPPNFTLISKKNNQLYQLKVDSDTGSTFSFPTGCYFYFECDPTGQLLMRPCVNEFLGFHSSDRQAKSTSNFSLPRQFTLNRSDIGTNVYKVSFFQEKNQMWDSFNVLKTSFLVYKPSGKFVLQTHGKECKYLSRTDSATKDKPIQYALPAQLLLWREEQDRDSYESRIEYKYGVSLIGVSGPATKALTALLVDDEQKWGIWGSTPDGLREDLDTSLSRYLPLNTLQTHIRTSFFRKYQDCLKEQNIPPSAIQLSCTYLSTILPQYFLPFLSKSDEKRISNALEAFLRMTDAENIPLLESLVADHTESLLGTLQDLLDRFRGVDALYQVGVTVTPTTSNTDNRKITGIKLLTKNDPETPIIDCLYVNDPLKK